MPRTTPASHYCAGSSTLKTCQLPLHWRQSALLVAQVLRPADYSTLFTQMSAPGSARLLGEGKDVAAWLSALGDNAAGVGL